MTFDDEERLYGAAAESKKARWKLDIILRTSHPQLLIALARFVAEGNEILVLRGNHDSEMFFPEVQEHFRRLIAEHHPDDVSYMAMKEAVAARVQFPQWFWYVPGLLYVEHGCQYDTFCSFEHFMNPVEPGRPDRIEMSISELSIRYFTNQMKLINAMAAENIKSVSEYVGWVVRGNLAILPRVLWLYAEMVRRVLAKSGRRDSAAERTVREEHLRQVAAVDARFDLPAGTALAVDAMHQSPVMRRWWATARFLALDLFVVGFALAGLVALILLRHPGRVGLLALVGVAAAIGLVFYVGGIRLRKVTEAGALHQTAEQLAARFRVPYVVLGHSHGAGTWPLTQATYVNVGTWVPMSEEAFFVFFALMGGEDTRDARLWRWSKRQQHPEPFNSEVGPGQSRAA